MRKLTSAPAQNAAMLETLGSRPIPWYAAARVIALTNDAAAEPTA